VLAVQDESVAAARHYFRFINIGAKSEPDDSDLAEGHPQIVVLNLAEVA